MRTPFAGIPILVSACLDDPQIGVEPANSQMNGGAATVTQADDINRGTDIGMQTLPPVIQGPSNADITITRAIRRYLALDRYQPVETKNVTIATRDGVVTLRGLVNSNDERGHISAAADLMAGAGHVIDELTVITS